MDYATTTPVDPRVLKAMAPFWSADFGNPSSIHSLGVVAERAVLEAETDIAKVLRAHRDEIIFTSGGTEANNLAIFGVVEASRSRGVSYKKMHAITSVIEHSSVLECFRELERRGVSVDYIPVSEEGIVDTEMIKEKIKKETVLVSIMYANNEIGTIQPISKIAKLLRAFKNRPIFHIDASQAPLYLDVTVEKLGVDLMTLDGHKIYGPKGVGVLFKKRGVSLRPILFGGGHAELRPGTKAVPLIVGMAEALKIAATEREKESKRLITIRDFLRKELVAVFPNVLLNGGSDNCLPNILNVSFPGVDTEFLTLQLSEAGIFVSTKSACMRDEKDSYVIKALGSRGRKENISASSIRFSLGRGTKESNIEILLKILKRSL